MIFVSKNIFAQDLILQTEACPKTPVLFQAPTDPNATSYQWDFCTGDLLFTPQATLISDFMNDETTSNPDFWQPEGLDIVFDGENWYGFITNLQGENLIRADFGNSLNNVPVYRNLGIIGGTAIYDQPSQIKIIKGNDNNWYGFIASNGFSASATGSSIVRLNFGSSLTNFPIATFFQAGYFTTSPNTGITGFQIIYDEGVYRLICPTFVRNSALTILNSSITTLNFGNSLSSTPSVTSFVFSIPPSTLRDLNFIKSNDNWYAFATSTTNGRTFYRIDFGNSLSNNPTILDLSSKFPFVSRYAYTILDGKNYILHTINVSGNLYRINFGEDIENINPNVHDLGNLGQLGLTSIYNSPSIAFSLKRQESEWFGFAINRQPFRDPQNPFVPNNINRLIRFKFPNNCNAVPSTATTANVDVEFLKSGNQAVNLQTFDSGGNLINTYSDAIDILDATIGNFTTDNQCFGETVQFNNISFGLDENVTAWNWDFGDGNSSTLKSPTHQYGSAGLYAVKLTVNNVIGCVNTFTQNVRISNRPIADFNIDSLACATGVVQFTDLSRLTAVDISNGGQIIERLWQFGDGRRHFASPLFPTPQTTIIKIDNSIDLETPYQKLSPGFVTENKYNVSLTITDEAGCVSTVTKQISLKQADAPITDFAFGNVCEGVPMVFEDLSRLPNGVAGEINSWQWTFLGGLPSGSTTQNPLVSYNTAGDYNVTLTTQNAQGCINTANKPISVKPSINSQFQASAIVGVIPLTVQFTNQSTGASSYFWDFDNGDISTSESPIYTFTEAGTYFVKFQAKNEFGCGKIAERKIIVDENPTAIEDELKSAFTIYPNPTQGNLFIKTKNNNFQKIQFIITDTKGKIVSNSATQSFQEMYQLDISNLNSGLYLLKIQVDNQYFVNKIIKN